MKIYLAVASIICFLGCATHKNAPIITGKITVKKNIARPIKLNFPVHATAKADSIRKAYKRPQKMFLAPIKINFAIGSKIVTAPDLCKLPHDTLFITGSADSLPWRGKTPQESARLNLNLSHARAAKVAYILIHDCGNSKLKLKYLGASRLGRAVLVSTKGFAP